METVLVLEDEPSNLKVIALALRLDGYRVLEAVDGNAAIQICNEDRKPIDVLVAGCRVFQDPGSLLSCLTSGRKLQFYSLRALRWSTGHLVIWLVSITCQVRP
jgi:CheY-like chemotaxis protein